MDNQALNFLITFSIPFVTFALIRPKQAILTILVLSLFTGPIKMLLEIRESPLVLDITLITALIALFIANHILRREDFLLPRLSIPVFILLLASFFQMFNDSIINLQAALEGFRISAFYMIAFFAARYTITTKEDLLFLMKLFIACSFIVGVYGIRQHYFPFDGEIYWAMADTQQMQLFWGKQMRVFSTLNGLGAFAMFIPLGVITHIALYNLTHSRKGKNIIIVSLSFFAVAALFSMTRSAWVSSIIGIFVLLFAMDIKQKKRTIFLLGSFLVLGVLFLKVLPNSEVLQNRFDTFDALEQDTGVMGRFYIMRDAVTALQENPMGNGIGTTSSGIVTHFSTTAVAGHNQFLDIALELGILPGLFYVFIIFYSLWYGWRLIRETEDPVIRISAAWITGYNLAFQAISMQGQTFGFPQSLHFWFLLGLLMCLENLPKDSAEKNENNVPPAKYPEKVNCS